MEWFAGCTCIEEAKKRYQELIKKYHPDLGGDTATMAAINVEFETVFVRLKNTHRSANGETYQKESNESFAEYQQILEILIHIPNVKIEIIGSWIWVTGDTRPVKEVLKEAGFQFSGKKAAWYWHAGEYHKRHGKNYSMDDLRGKWGTQEVEKEEYKAVSVGA